jgi:hypothetical protein
MLQVVPFIHFFAILSNSEVDSVLSQLWVRVLESMLLPIAGTCITDYLRTCRYMYSTSSLLRSTYVGLVP